MTKRTTKPEPTAAETYAARRNDIARLMDVLQMELDKHADGHWGPKAGAPGGFRLFEIDRDRDDAPTEHDPVYYDTWDAGDLIDYLNAVGQLKARPSTTRTTDPTT